MNINTNKRNENGKPNCVKYCICVLENIDPHLWNKIECFVPVLSAMELCFLVNLATKKKCVPKNGNVSQAFCQAYLLPDKKYVCTPLAGDILTPSKIFLWFVCLLVGELSWGKFRYNSTINNSIGCLLGWLVDNASVQEYVSPSVLLKKTLFGLKRSPRH